MLFRVLSYLKFLQKSTNEHGVHSPFVFKFVTQCLYAKKKLHNRKAFNVFLKTVNFFDAKSVSVLDNLEAAQVVMQSVPDLHFEQPPFDLVYAENLEIFHFNQLLSGGKLHNNSLILVEGIHTSREKWEQWTSLISETPITVSIDMFHLGAIFIRREQEKEHFTIRI
nr:hypothetical protein [Allomuricauda sp.]